MDPKDVGYQEINGIVYKDGHRDSSATGALQNYQTQQLFRKRKEDELMRERKEISLVEKLHIVEILKKILLSPNFLLSSHRIVEETHGLQRTIVLTITIFQFLEKIHLDTDGLHNLRPKEVTSDRKSVV